MFSAMFPFESLAIVGLDTAWAGCDGLEAFEQMVYELRQQFARVEGGSLPGSGGEALLTKVAQQALQDAGVDMARLAGRPGGLRPDGSRPDSSRVAAFGCAAAPLNLSWDWAVSFVDLYGDPNPLVAALARAQQLLSGGAADLVLFAAGSGLAEIPAGLALASGDAGMGFDREVHGWRLGEGAGAVVLMRAEHARQEGRRIYAVIRSAASAPGAAAAVESVMPAPPALDDLRGCCKSALEAAGVSPEQVGYIEAFASGSDALDGIEIAGLVQAYRLPVQDFPRAQGTFLSAALGSAQSNAGYLGAAAGLAGLVRAALCLYHRSLPGVPGWSAPKLPALWKNAPFYLPGESRPWFEKEAGPGRTAGVNLIGLNGSCAHLILAEREEQTPAGKPALHANRALARGGFFLFPLAGDSLEDLLSELENLQQSLIYARDLNSLAADCYEEASHCPGAAYGAAIVGHGHEEIQREIEYALKAIPAVFEKAAAAGAQGGGEWQTPLGSYFTADPAGRQGGVAFVYPGAFNSYPGVGKDLFRLFPSLHQHAAGVTGDLGRVMRERLLYPRSLAAISKDEIAALEASLLADPIAMLISGTTLTILYTQILQETFKIRPAAAFGYSLGENSMMYATGVWAQGDSASGRLEESAAFRVRLAGEQRAIREYWGYTPGQEDLQPLWSNYLVMCPPEKVQAALGSEPRVYLTHINTPRQVVIGGDPQGCKRVLAALRCSSLQAPFDYALHCQVMRSEYEELAELHNWPVEKVPALRMYSAADYGPLNIAQNEQSQREIANAMAHMLTSALDFPRLVNQVYADGARVFIEAGAGGNCARWVDESLKGRPHLALSLNRRGTDDYSNLVRVMARLYSHRVPLDLSPLYQPLLDEVSQ